MKGQKQDLLSVSSLNTQTIEPVKAFSTVHNNDINLQGIIHK